MEADAYNDVTARMMMRILTQGTHDVRVVVRVDGAWDVKSPVGRCLL
jgi:hypothetical protein